MLTKLAKLFNEIEELRNKLNQTVSSKGFTDPEVMQMNKWLDHLLNEYQEMLKVIRMTA